MATTYQAYGARPGNASTYPNAQLPNINYPPLDRTGSMESDASEDNGSSPYKQQEYTKVSNVRTDIRPVTRTPSPTPSEATELSKKHLFDFKAMMKWSYWFRKEWIWYYIITVIITVIFILFTVYHKQIVKWLQPAANWMHDLPAGWLIPIAILFVISFPPLFGHEIVAILCGVVWGLGPGFAIVAAGTFLGEVGNFYAFRYCCSARGEKMEKQKIQYACLARVVREGGFKIALIARFSAIPGHFTTAVFSTCGMNIWVFMIAAFLSLPKQFLTVYLGVALEDSESGQSSKKDTIIKDVVLVVTAAITFIAMWYIYHLMAKAKPAVIYERRKARQAKMLSEGASGVYGNSSVLQSTASVPYSQNVSEAELPLTASFKNEPGYQQWDPNGRAVGYAPDPMLYAPQPQRPTSRMPLAESQTPSSRGSSSTSTPAMSEREREGYRQPPSRQNTSSSANSWDVRAHVGGPDAYKMSTSMSASAAPAPYRDPYVQNAYVGGPGPSASPVPARLLPPPSSSSQQLAQQQQLPPPAYTHSPAPAPRAPLASAEPTPTQAQFVYLPPAGPPPSGLQTPPSAPLPNPYTPPPPLPSYQTQQQQGAQHYDPYSGYSSSSQSPRPQ